MPNAQEFEVVIIGGGPAGAATALTLAQADRQILLVDKSDGSLFKVGEGLPPNAKPLLRDLGVMERFNSDEHLPSYGNVSAWGTPSLHSTDFIFNPHGHSWHLDRLRFDEMLREAASKAGTEVRKETRMVKLVRVNGEGWQLTLEEKSKQVQVYCQWLVDCTGRASRVARNLGVKKSSEDQLLGFVTLFRRPDTAVESDRDSMTLIESTSQGWWYTALLPSERRVVAYFTDADLETSKLAQSVEGYTSLLYQTQHIYARLATYGYTLEGTPKVACANSTRLETFVGDGWLAVGDAALSFDPLSSQGITTALYSGLKAGEALKAHLSGDSDPLALYGENLSIIYDSYLHNRTVFYSYERRWLQSEFWRRRRLVE